MHESYMCHCHRDNVVHEGILVVIDRQHLAHVVSEVVEKELVDFTINAVDHKWQ